MTREEERLPDGATGRHDARAFSVALALMGALFAGHAASAQETPRQLIYLHGRIVQDQQSARPKHPEWGTYELDAIRDAFRKRGFVLTSEIRPKANSVSQSADHLVAQVKSLLASGTPTDRLTVVGGSMGAAITLVAAVRLQNPELRFAVLGACMSQTVPMLVAEHGKKPAGRFLAITDRSDELSEPCPAWSASDGGPTLAVREVRIDTGQHHGFLYRPLPEWVEPVVEFATAR